MSEIQTIKTAIHEIAHAKLHAVTPGEKVAPEDKKDRRTKEVEAESVAYTVCQRYGIETSDILSAISPVGPPTRRQRS